MKKRTISKEECCNFNTVREENVGKIFSTQEMLAILTKLGFKRQSMLKDFVKLGALIKPSYGNYAFTSEPVHLNKLNNVLACSRVIHKQNRSETNEEKAIELLKSLGYEIRKATLNKEQALKNPDSPVKNFIQWVKI